MSSSSSASSSSAVSEVAPHGQKRPAPSEENPREAGLRQRTEERKVYLECCKKEVPIKEARQCSCVRAGVCVCHSETPAYFCAEHAVEVGCATELGDHFIAKAHAIRCPGGHHRPGGGYCCKDCIARCEGLCNGKLFCYYCLRACINHNNVVRFLCPDCIFMPTPNADVDLDSHTAFELLRARSRVKSLRY